MKNEPCTHGRYLIREAIGSRSGQEDASICLVNPEADAAFVLVCDGVGGSSDGGGASRLVIDYAEKFWKEKGEILREPEQDLAAFAREAHQNLKQENPARTTLVALYRTATQAVWMHSGDSRLYHFRAGRLVTRTRDHSVVEILVQQGAVSESEMGTHPDQGRLLQSLGGTDYEEPTFGASAVTPDDAFLLCTDGFWERMTPGEMVDILYGKHFAAPDALDRAVVRAVHRNGVKGDNVTVAVVLPVRSVGPRKSAVIRLLALLLIPELLYLVYYFATEWTRHHYH